jgi:hypothetical protein
MKRSFLTCPHKNIQQFTEVCLDCGYNIYTTEQEYLEDLRKKAGNEEIRKLEKKLKIKR